MRTAEFRVCARSMNICMEAAQKKVRAALWPSKTRILLQLAALSLLMASQHVREPSRFLISRERRCPDLCSKRPHAAQPNAELHAGRRGCP